MDTVLYYSGFRVYVARLGLEVYLLRPPDPSSLGIATLLINRNSFVLEGVENHWSRRVGDSKPLFFKNHVILSSLRYT